MSEPVNLLLTSCGCPGAVTLIRHLRSEARRDGVGLRIVGCDCDREAAGRFFVNEFTRVPPVADEVGYIAAMLSLVGSESIDIVLPESSLEVPILAREQGRFRARLLVSELKAINTAMGKLALYLAIGRELELGCKLLPKFLLVESSYQFVGVLKHFGYPEKPVCVKPPRAKGSRGFRILDARVDRADVFLNQKPGEALYVTPEEVVSTFGDHEFPRLLVMEYLEGEEVAVDALCLDGEMLLATCKTVERARWGVIVRGELVERPKLLEASRRIIEMLGLSWCVNLQFKGGKLLEVNPRISSLVYQDDLVIPWLAIKLALGRITKQEVQQMQCRVAIGRRLVRYFDELCYG